LTDDIVQPHDDATPKLTGGLCALTVGRPGVLRLVQTAQDEEIYGSTGTASSRPVDFGPTIHAKALMSGGESGDPASPHFTDQALMFSQAVLRDVLFYPEDVRAHAERSYQP